MPRAGEEKILGVTFGTHGQLSPQNESSKLQIKKPNSGLSELNLK